MKVKELISILQNHDQEKAVVFSDPNCEGSFGVDIVSDYEDGFVTLDGDAYYNFNHETGEYEDD